MKKALVLTVLFSPFCLILLHLTGWKGLQSHQIEMIFNAFHTGVGYLLVVAGGATSSLMAWNYGNLTE